MDEQDEVLLDTTFTGAARREMGRGQERVLERGLPLDGGHADVRATLDLDRDVDRGKQTEDGGEGVVAKSGSEDGGSNEDHANVVLEHHLSFSVVSHFRTPK